MRATLRLVQVLGGTLDTVVRVAWRGGDTRDLGPWARGLLRRLRVRVEVEGELDEAAPLWVANHLSWLDPIVLLALRPASVLAKAEVASYPILGAWSRRVGLRFVDRNNPLSRAQAVNGLARDLRLGRPFVLFPEGTTTRGEGLARLQPGGLLAAHRTDTPIQPLRLDSPDAHYPWVGDMELLPHLHQLAQAEGTTIRVQARPRLRPADYPTETAWLQAAARSLHP